MRINGSFGFKKCPGCKIIFALEGFHKDSHTKTGVRAYCKNCSNEKSKQYQKDNRDERLAYNKKYHKENIPRMRNLRWKSSGININMDQYTKKLIEQNNCCAICKTHKDNFNVNLGVDHNHITGKVRGLLCDKCNRFIVYVVEHKEHLINVTKEYLKLYEDR